MSGHEMARVLSGERSWAVVEGDCIEVLRHLPDASIDAVCTDPPYGIGFMGVGWDTFSREPKGRTGHDRSVRFDHVGGNHNPVDSRDSARTRLSEGRKFQAWCEAWARECLRVLKPGGHLVSFGGCRTYHRLASGVEDAGFEVRDSLHWIFGSGFPKSLDVSKAIDRAAGAERESVGTERNFGRHRLDQGKNALGDFAGEWEVCPNPATDAAHRWQGWGSALKPAHEPIVLARKPLVGSIAANVLAHGTGALNVEACRVEPTGERLGGGGEQRASLERSEGWTRPWMRDPDHQERHAAKVRANVEHATDAGRWPPNVLLGEEAATEVDRQTEGLIHSAGSATGPKWSSEGWFGAGRNGHSGARFGDDGGASRFFPIFKYEAKADRAERDEALADLPARTFNRVNPGGLEHDPRWAPTQVRNHHPTVKPVALMVWLCRLVTPPGGIVLDPFTGSGTTGIAARRCGFRFVGIEREAEYAEIARARIDGDMGPMFRGLDAEAAG